MSKFQNQRLMRPLLTTSPNKFPIPISETSSGTVSPQSPAPSSSVQSEYEYPVILERQAGIIRNPIRHRERRVIEKIGCSNIISLKNLSTSKSIRYARDLSNTIIDSRWRWTLITFVLTYFFNWLLFGTLWMWVGQKHTEFSLIFSNKTCFIETETFTAFFLLAVESQTTIGFGGRSITEDCPDAIFLLCLQMLLSICINGAFMGAVYAKMIRPMKHAKTRMFSKNAVISQRDGKLCLMFRVGDLKNAHIVGTDIQLYMVKKHVTFERETLKNYFTELKLQPFGLLLWPLTLVHVIDETSPLYDMSARDLLIKRFELIAVLRGSSESTSQSSQICTSYLSNEILWGNRIVECVTYDNIKESYVVDRNLFHKTRKINTPLCSAKRLNDVIWEFNSQINH